MDYNEAFELIVGNYKYQILDDTFLVRSFLLDYTHNEAESVSLVNAYCILNKSESIYQNIKNLSLNDAKQYIKGVIIKSDTKITPLTYIRSVEPLLTIIYGNEYKKVEVAKVKKVSAVKKNNKAIHASPIISQNNHQPQVATPNKKPKKIKRKIFINISCLSLDIRFIDGNAVELKDDAGRLYNSLMRVTKNNNDYSFFYKAKDKNLIFNVPRSIFSSMYIAFSGTFLDVQDVENRTSFESIELNANCSFVVFTQMQSKKLLIESTGTEISLFGDYNNIKVKGLRTGVEAFLSSAPKNVNIKTDIGNISLRVSNKITFPKVNHFLKKVKHVDGSYFIGGSVAHLKLSTKIGKIKVY